MTNLQFQKLLTRLAGANEKYKELLNKAEEEYKERYGVYPSDIDDDYWIDTFHVGCGHLTVSKLEEYMKNKL